LLRIARAYELASEKEEWRKVKPAILR